MNLTRLRRLMLIVTLVAGAVLLGYYTWWLFYDDLRSWKQIVVYFEDVGGLKKDNEVQVAGTRMGRVARIELAKQSGMKAVLLEIEPDLSIHEEGHEVAIVPLNALGFVAVRINPGEAHSPDVASIATRVQTIESLEVTAPVLRGKLQVGLGQSKPQAGGESPIDKTFSDLRGFSRDLLRPDSSAAGSLVADGERARDLDEGLAGLEQLWIAVDQNLARVEAGEGPGVLLASRDTALALGETASWLRGVFTNVRDGIEGLETRDDLIGRLMADPDAGHSVREFLRSQSALWKGGRQGEGLIGSLHGPELGEALTDLTSRTREWTAAGQEGRGLLGVLSHPDYDPVGEGLHALPAALEDLERSPLVRGDGAKETITDAFSEADDAIKNLRRGVEGLRHGLPDRASFQGALFAIF